MGKVRPGTAVRWRPLIGSRSGPGRRKSTLVKEVLAVREFHGVPYALLSWQANGMPHGRPLCEWVSAADLADYYEEA